MTDDSASSSPTTGMKQGAGEDPFADDDDSAPTEQEARHRRKDEETESQTQAPDRGQQSHMRIPYKFRREGVQDGRDRVPLFLQEETKRDEVEARREMEDRFGDEVSLTDLREAIVKAGLCHPDEVAEHLEEWGYGMTFDE